MARYDAKARENSRKAALAQHRNMTPEMREFRRAKISSTLMGSKCAEGHVVSDEARKRMSKSMKGRSPWNKGKKLPLLSKEHKRKIREGCIRHSINTGKTFPCIGKQENSILEVLEDEFDCNIYRQHLVSGYFLDGYIPEENIAIEIDETSHYTNNKLIERDIQRQSEIESDIGCKFVRIKIN